MKLHHLLMSLALSSAAAMAEEGRNTAAALSLETAASAFANAVAELVMGDDGDDKGHDPALFEAAERREEERLEAARRAAMFEARLPSATISASLDL